MWRGRRRETPAAEAHAVIVYLHVTQRCNLRCTYCYMDAGPAAGGELSTARLRALLSALGSFQPDRLVMTGGEPLVRGDLLHLARHFRRLAPSVRLCLSSNGSLVDSKVAGPLVELFDEIRISLDGLEATNDALRGQGAFVAALRGIGAVLAAGGEPSIATTLTAANVAEVSLLVHYMAAEWGIRLFRLNPLKPLGRAAAASDLALPAGAQVPTLALEGLPEPITYACCPADGSCIGSTMSITPTGDVFPCHWLARPEYHLGHATGSSLAQAFARLQALRQQPGAPPDRVC